MKAPACSKCPHRQRPCGGPCACTISGVEWTEHRDRGYCPLGVFGTTIKPEGWDMLPPSGAEVYGPPRPAGVSMEQRGRELWAELHKADPDPAWLERWEKRLPCGDCKKEYRVLKDADPPDFSSAGAFFAWGVRIHNIVNERLNKPILSLADAQARWSE